MAAPEPGPGELRIRVRLRHQPGDIKKCVDAFGFGMPCPRVIPHSNGAGTIEAVGPGVSASGSGASVRSSR